LIGFILFRYFFQIILFVPFPKKKGLESRLEYCFLIEFTRKLLRWTCKELWKSCQKFTSAILGNSDPVPDVRWQLFTAHRLTNGKQAAYGLVWVISKKKDV